MRDAHARKKKNTHTPTVGAYVVLVEVVVGLCQCTQIPVDFFAPAVCVCNNHHPPPPHMHKLYNIEQFILRSRGAAQLHTAIPSYLHTCMHMAAHKCMQSHTYARHADSIPHIFCIVYVHLSILYMLDNIRQTTWGAHTQPTSPTTSRNTNTKKHIHTHTHDQHCTSRESARACALELVYIMEFTCGMRRAVHRATITHTLGERERARAHWAARGGCAIHTHTQTHIAVLVLVVMWCTTQFCAEICVLNACFLRRLCVHERAHSTECVGACVRFAAVVRCRRRRCGDGGAGQRRGSRSSSINSLFVQNASARVHAFTYYTGAVSGGDLRVCVYVRALDVIANTASM